MLLKAILTNFIKEYEKQTMDISNNTIITFFNLPLL